MPAQPDKRSAPVPQAEEPMSYARYRALRKACWSQYGPAMVFVGLLTLPACFVIGLFLYRLPDDPASPGFILAGLLGLGFLLFLLAAGVRVSRGALTDAERELEQQAPAEDWARFQRDRRRRRAVLALLCLVIAGLTVAPYAVRSRQMLLRYREGEALIFAGRYAEGERALLSLRGKDYRDTEALLLLSDAHRAYEAGRLSSADFSLQRADFRWQPEERMNEIQAFRQQVHAEYTALAQAEDAAAREERERALDERVRSGVPFRGMPEDRIAQTTLGWPDPAGGEPGTTVLNGSEVPATVYRFYDRNHRYVIFTATCADGTVVSVSDLRSNPYDPAAGKRVRSVSSPYPDPEAFVHPQDFYEWYIDDFYDYEEAEEYYNEYYKNKPSA